MYENCPFCILKGNRLKFLNFNMFLSMKTVFILANSADHDEMPHYAAFHQGLHCLSTYRFTGTKNEKG